MSAGLISVQLYCCRLQKRNNSILAHGLESQTKEDFEKFLDMVLTLSRKLDKDMNKFIKETKFTKFDIKLKINAF